MDRSSTSWPTRPCSRLVTGSRCTTCAPLPRRSSRFPGLAFELEYAQEDNGELRNSTAWNAQGSYEFGGWLEAPDFLPLRLLPGRRPRHLRQRGVRLADPRLLRLGHLVAGRNRWRVLPVQLQPHLAPGPAAPDAERPAGLGIDRLQLHADQPASFAPGVTSKNIATELDGYADWKINSNFTVSLVAAFADPKEAAEQGYGRTSNFTYGMLYIAYAF